MSENKPAPLPTRLTHAHLIDLQHLLDKFDELRDQDPVVISAQVRIEDSTVVHVEWDHCKAEFVILI